MVEFRASPALFGMAAIAFPAIGATVSVVCLVTRDAIHWQRQILAFSVASCASDLTVSRLKRKFRIPVMIESSHVPGLRLVAVVALRPEAPQVNILAKMAVDTLRGRESKARIEVAGRATHILMAAQ